MRIAVAHIDFNGIYVFVKLNLKTEETLCVIHKLTNEMQNNKDISITYCLARCNLYINA